MADKMRKIYCEERMKDSFEDTHLSHIKEMCGYYWPDNQKNWKKGKEEWVITMLWEGDYYTANSQAEAEMIANTEMIKGLLLKKKGERNA